MSNPGRVSICTRTAAHQSGPATTAQVSNALVPLSDANCAATVSGPSLDWAIASFLQSARYQRQCNVAGDANSSVIGCDARCRDQRGAEARLDCSTSSRVRGHNLQGEAAELVFGVIALGEHE